MKPWLRSLIVSLLITSAQAAEFDWGTFFKEDLVNASGEKVSPQKLHGKMVCLYFSAAWCGPCKFFTPKLVQFRNRYQDHLEVVFVSQDHSEKEQLAYMKANNMSWPALKWADYKLDNGNAARRLMGKYQGWGIPTLVCLSPAGELIDGDARLKIQELPEERLRRLQDYDYGKAIQGHRDFCSKQGETLTKVKEDEFLAQLKIRIQDEISGAQALHQESLKPYPLGSRPSWQDLLCNYYQHQRMNPRKE